MSDEQLNEDEAEVEAHRRANANEEPTEEGADDDVEAHVRAANVRADNVRDL
jgi:hypothetical protein